MRKTGIIVAIYSVIAFAICLLISHLMKNLPVLLPGENSSYILTRAFLFFCKFLPALVFSGFLIGCAIAYGKDSEKAQIKYSPLIMEHFRKTMIASIIIVLIVSFITEVFVPLFEQRQARAKIKPVLFSEFITLSKDYFDKGNMSLAFEYSYNALLLSPKDKDALYINEHASAELNSLKMVLDRPEEPKFVFVPAKETKGETITSLLNKARVAAEKENWFDAHYYAYLAVEVGNEKDINLEEANRLASEAWNHLFDPSVIKETDEQILFRKKREAYRTLIRGDNVEAYYQFLEIANFSDVAARDPDVSKFLVIAEQRLVEQCFFIEEVENLRRFEAYNNIYFAIPHDDGSKDVVYIRGITPVKNSGRMVQYLRGFSLFTYSKDGDFLRSIYVPYAKMLSQTTDSFDESAKLHFGIKDSFKTVPYLMLECVSKTDRNGRISPVYEYDADYTKENEPYLNNYFVLGLPQKDFNLLCDAAAGSRKMSLISLIRFLPKTLEYGYSYEVYNSDFLFRVTYPLIMLICCIFMACMAWNYRLNDSQLFKFKWIFLMPAITVILYFVIECGLYICRMLNYALVVMLGGGAVFVSIPLLVVILLIVCVNFVSRTAD
ncbi:MAG: hypothetical protein IJJ71_06565 [Treponema sp.]|uniref:hypothetical protein n=1 Tax=Treponema sp. TaxID=166 RepID=UPI0025ECB667|nr:hypothetical protein [Treponema sp.]MBR0495817.1 hypothetical protein [Treponema sp.]